jgi:hypothetical protein
LFTFSASAPVAPRRNDTITEGPQLEADRLYQPETNTYRCPAGEQLIWRYTTVEQAPRSA